jgi:hypothetical protein
VMVELAQDEGLGILLSALHYISPQVFVTRADSSAPPAASPEPRGAALAAARRAN